MGNHSRHAWVLEAGCTALQNVGWSNTDVQRQIKEAGGEAVLRSALSASDASPVAKGRVQKLLDRLARV